jgi:hypothetical protein
LGAAYYCKQEYGNAREDIKKAQGLAYPATPISSRLFAKLREEKNEK